MNQVPIFTNQDQRASCFLTQIIAVLFDLVKLLSLKPLPLTLKLSRLFFDHFSMKIILKLILCVSTLALAQGCIIVERKSMSLPWAETALRAEMVPMVSTWRTSSRDEVIKLPLKSGYRYHFTVDWGDGSPESRVTFYGDPDRIHTYAAPGDYTITIKGLVEAWGTTEEETGTSPTDPETLISSPHQDQIIRVDNLGQVGWVDLSFAFYNCQNLTFVSGGDTSNVTDMSYMFHRATAATPDVGGWDTSKVLNMSSMFSKATSANPDVSQWDTSKVLLMQDMFNGASSAIPDVGDWDTSNVTDMRFMFSGAISATPDVGDWDTSSVTDMRFMFRGASSAHPDVGDWDTSNVTDMQHMFYGASSAHPDVGGWDTSKVTEMGYMFYGATVAHPDVSHWDTSNVTGMRAMFSRATIANPDVSHWDTSKVLNMSSMFSKATSANPDVSQWDTSKVLLMQDMFNGATVAHPDVSQWDTSKVIDMGSMFFKATSANPDVSQWDTSKVLFMQDMFNGATVANPDLSGFNFEALDAPLDNFIRGTGISIVNYSKLLVEMNRQTISPLARSTSFDSPVQYNSTATAARSSLVSAGWRFNDGGLLEEE